MPCGASGNMFMVVAIVSGFVFLRALCSLNIIMLFLFKFVQIAVSTYYSFTPLLPHPDCFERPFGIWFGHFEDGHDYYYFKIVKL